MFSLVFALVPILLIIAAVNVIQKLSSRRKRNIVVSHTYQPPVAVPMPHPFSSAYPILETPFTMKLEVYDRNGVFMDDQNANIDRLAPNDSRLAHSQLPVIQTSGTPPPAYDTIIV